MGDDNSQYAAHWPEAGASPGLDAVFKSRPEDFQVDEIAGFEPDGHGEHVCLLLEKRNLSTPEAVRLLARQYGVPARDVAYAGLKDKVGVTRQWISLRVGVKRELPLPPPRHEGLRILRQERNSRKIRRGSHRGNAFRIRLRAPSHGPEALADTLRRMRDEGVPNYFGPQRFGHGGDNVTKALAWFRGEFTPRDRFLRGMLLSAARSWLFNTLLGQRVGAGTWNTRLDGDVMALNGTTSSFLPELWDDTLAQRLANLDIHPSGPLWGRGEPPSRGRVRDLEMAVARDFPVLCEGLAGRGLSQERRALRLKVDGLRAWMEEEKIGPAADNTATDDGFSCSKPSLMIEFSLAKGGYATAVLKELMTTSNPVV